MGPIHLPISLKSPCNIVGGVTIVLWGSKHDQIGRKNSHKKVNLNFFKNFYEGILFEVYKKLNTKS